MPENVISHILNRLPIQYAVRTSILSRNWRLKWTNLTQLVFDEEFVVYILIRFIFRKGFEGRHLSRILLHLKGDITKFVLDISVFKTTLDDEDINHWIMYLSQKRIKELTLTNATEELLKLPTHLSSCLELTHLKLHKCVFILSPSFSGFPNLLSLDLNLVRSVNFKYFELICGCPLLENLKIRHDELIGELKPDDIAKLKNLKMLSMSLCILDNMVSVTCSSIFRVIGSLPKLQELDLDFRKCKFLAEVGARKRVPTVLPCLTTLKLNGIDFSSDITVSCVLEMICGSPNLKTLYITAAYMDDVPQRDFCYSEVDSTPMRQLQLRNVVFPYMRGSDYEICFIEFLLVRAPWLKALVIHPSSPPVVVSDSEKLTYAKKLLKLNRASPVAQIELHYFAS